MTAARPKQSIRDRIKDFRRVKASELREHPLNWRSHPANQRDALGGLLSEIGFAGAVLARETPDGLELIDGHLRREMTGDTEIPVLITDLDEREAALLLADYDPIAALAEADKSNLDQLLKSVQTDDESLRRLLDDVARDAGVKTTETKDASAKIDRAAELQREWQTESGQLWRIGEHRLLIGDSTKREDVERLMRGERADSVVADPPYGCTDIEWDRYPSQGELDMYFGLTDGPIVLFGAALPRCLYALLSLEPQAERVYVWWNTFTLTHSEGAFWQWQPIYVWRKAFVKGLDRDVIDMAANTGGDTKYHETQKPVALLMRLLESVPDGCNFDPFVGSGTTIVAAQNLNRRCFAMEISPAYAAVCLQRMKDAFGIVGELAS